MWQHLQLHKIPVCDQRLEENAPRGNLFCCNDVIKEIYFCTKLSLSPFLKCKCNHVTYFPAYNSSVPPVFHCSGFQIMFFPRHQNHLSDKISTPQKGTRGSFLDLTGSAAQPRGPLTKAAVKSLQLRTGQPPPPAHSVTQMQGEACTLRPPYAL